MFSWKMYLLDYISQSFTFEQHHEFFFYLILTRTGVWFPVFCGSKERRKGLLPFISYGGPHQTKFLFLICIRLLYWGPVFGNLIKIENNITIFTSFCDFSLCIKEVSTLWVTWKNSREFFWPWRVCV